MSLLDPEFYDPEGTDPRSEVGAGRIPLDVLHHDMPERHVIGKTMLAPQTVKAVGITVGDATPGKSPAPAREDHVHGPPASVVAPYPLGRLVTGSWLATPVNIPAGGPTTVANQISFVPLLGRMYKVVVNARAFGPNPGGVFASGKFQIFTLGILDHWFCHPGPGGGWAGIHVESFFAGDGLATTWTLQVNNMTAPSQMYGSDYYIEDVGKV